MKSAEGIFSCLLQRNAGRREASSNGQEKTSPRPRRLGSERSSISRGAPASHGRSRSMPCDRRLRGPASHSQATAASALDPRRSHPQTSAPPMANDCAAPAPAIKRRRTAFSFDPPQPGVAFLDLRPGDCRWPIGDPRDGDFGFCGAPAQPGSSYCLHCHKLAYLPPRPRRSGKPSA